VRREAKSRRRSPLDESVDVFAIEDSESAIARDIAASGARTPGSRGARRPQK
jgi:hypothetical protein